MAFNFGSSMSQPASGFGSTGSTFGASTHSAAGTLFGAGTGQSNATFGNTSTTNNTPAGTLFGSGSATGGGFGSTTSTAGGTTGFGSTAATSAPGTGFGFGGTNIGTGFGNTSTASTGFGTNANTAFGKPATTGFGATATNTGFGANTNTGFGTGTSTVFGSATGTGFGTGGGFGFGGQQQQQQQQQQPSMGSSFSFGSGFGSTGATNSLYGSSQQQQNAQQQLIPDQQSKRPWQQFAMFRGKWDPSSSFCVFKHYFYNVVAPTERHLYVCPPNQTEEAWQEAMRRSPDPNTMVPVLAFGFEDNLKRMRVQEQAKAALQERLEEATQRFLAVQQQHNLSTTIRLEEQKRQQINLTRRLIRLLRTVQILRYKGLPIQETEERLIQQLKNLSIAPESPERLDMALREAYARLQNCKREQAMADENSAETWVPVSLEAMNNLEKIINDRQEEIRQLTDILLKDLETLETYRVSLKNRKNVERPNSSFMA